jgi:hypothetical protein
LIANVLLVVVIMANLAWLVNPHACCPRMDKMCGDPEMTCSLSIGSGHLMDMSEPGCSDMMMASEYIRITLADQFSKGVNNYIPDTTPATLSQFVEKVALFYSRAVSEDVVEYHSVVNPPVKKPPLV